MGYGLGMDRDNERFVGYLVEAECDLTSCDERIRRGLDAKCEHHQADLTYDQWLEIEDLQDADDYDGEFDEGFVEGCSLFFCEKHRDQTYLHESAAAKPDTLDHDAFVLTDPSWAEWRSLPENAEWIQHMQARQPQRDA